MRFMVLWFLLTVPISFADSNPSVYPPFWGEWEEARRHYDVGNFEDALESFKENPSSDANYYYNLGTVYLKMGQVGRAFAYLEKAHTMAPRDADIQINWNQARSALSRVLGEKNIDPTSNWIESIADNAPLYEVRSILAVFGWILVLVWLRNYYKSRKFWKTLSHPASLFTLTAVGITSSLLFAQTVTQRQPAAACLDAQVIRSGPGDQFLEIAKLSPGTKVRMIGSPTSHSSNSDELWRQIRYSGDSIGWVRDSSLLPL